MSVAEKWFTANLRTIPTGLGGVPSDPVAWNLYQGLLAMAQDVAKTRIDLQRVQSDLQQALQELHSLKQQQR